MVSLCMMHLYKLQLNRTNIKVMGLLQNYDLATGPLAIYPLIILPNHGADFLLGQDIKGGSMFAQVQENYHIRGEEGEPDHQPTHRQSRYQAEGGEERPLSERGQDLGQHKPCHHEYHIQNEVKGHPVALEGDVVEVAQQQHGPADDGQGQQPGG